MFEDLLSGSKDLSFNIRSIWIADAAHQGASGVLNEAMLGSDRKSVDTTLTSGIDICSSVVVRPLLRSIPNDQPLRKRDAATTCGIGA